MSSPSNDHADAPNSPGRPVNRQGSSDLPTDPARLQREIDARQDHLARTVDELTARVAPKELARRTAADAQARARELVLDEDGALRVERVAAAGAVVLGLLGASIWRRRRS
ncbi:DUF3618 domain-containing protein [Quadrisphaera sp. DSM 44207]|uniref:DUF3618 domain-containing protein n=1 Tax=Quadrisphaera sp. DSM 44207 TaxID=1881057 RepID=UPI0008913DE3|nr:DUF3618 domain-containing protein [Quadrisphaera sp. DSM 44207]SDQ07291.1 Protein of unknown function [Quadrisphaera sp. DSM 44207]